MKFTLSWLKRHLDTDASLDEICAKLTAIGLEVENVEDKAKTYAPFKVVYVESAEKHPDADKLKVCKVKTDSGVIQVVCGGVNARGGMKAILAPEGSTVPATGAVMKKGMIRGQESSGMLASLEEMGLPQDSEKTIIDVDQKWDVGTPFTEVFGLNDAVIEINLTPNRADAAGVRGIARDLAAAGLGKLKSIDEKPVKGSGKSKINVSIEDKDGCPLFLGRMIEGVKNGPSPQWLQDLLKSIGLKPISALVDITNFINLDAARPLHVFDADMLKGNLVIRAAKPGEHLKGLTADIYKFKGGETVICDDEKVVSLAGIMGGMNSRSTEETLNVFLEAALFDPARIARTGRDHNVTSDSRYRFERGVDPEFIVTGMEIATKLILELCGGKASDVVTAGSMPKWQRTIDYDPSWFAGYIGIDVDAKEQKRILEMLGFDISGGKTWKVSPPSWRADVEGRADIAEEIIRIHGYEHIPSISVRSDIPVAHPAETPTLSKIRKARNALAARGLDECVTWSFMGRDLALAFSDNKPLEALTLKNPISSDLDVMRPSILPNLIAAAGANHARGQSDVALCEVGPTFKSVKPEGQPMVAAGIRAGHTGQRHWGHVSRAVDAYDAKADALAALEAVGAPAANAQVSRDAPSYYHPGRSGALRLGPNVLAYFGEIHPAILDEMGIKTPVSGFEIFLQNIPEAKKKAGTEKPLLKIEPLQAVSRDFAFLVDTKVNAADILKAAKSADKNLITDAYIFDIYTGKGVEPGKKSVALAVTLQPKEKSLTDKELEDISQKIVGAVIAKTGGTLRS